MVKIEGTEVYADNIVPERNKFIFIKDCKTKQKAMKFAKEIAKVHKEKIIVEENGYELI